MFQKPTNQQFAKIFDTIATRYEIILNPYAVSRRIEFLTKYARGKCLEVGAGSGVITKALTKNHKVVATDISPQMVQQIKKNLKIKAYICDAQKLPFADSAFETIIAAELIYYLDSPNKFLKEAQRILKPKGRLLLTSASKITRVYDLIRSWLRKLGFTSMYFDDSNRDFMSIKELKRLLYTAGFRVKKLERVILLPFNFFDPFNRFLEKTPFKHFCSFIFVYAEK